MHNFAKVRAPGIFSKRINREVRRRDGALARSAPRSGLSFVALIENGLRLFLNEADPIGCGRKKLQKTAKNRKMGDSSERHDKEFGKGMNIIPRTPGLDAVFAFTASSLNPMKSLR